MTLIHLMHIWRNWILDTPRLTIKKNFVSTELFGEIIYSLNAFVVICKRMRDLGNLVLDPRLLGTDQVETAFAIMFSAIKYRRSLSGCCENDSSLRAQGRRAPNGAARLLQAAVVL